MPQADPKRVIFQPGPRISAPMEQIASGAVWMVVPRSPFHDSWGL